MSSIESYGLLNKPLKILKLLKFLVRQTKILNKIIYTSVIKLSPDQLMLLPLNES